MIPRLAVFALPLLILVGCGDDELSNSEGVYCAAAKQHAEVLGRPAITTGADIDAAIAVYDEMHAKAPLAVQVEWGAMAALLRATKDVDLTDLQATSDLNRMARETKDAADRVIIYTQQKCQVLIGDTPVASVPLVPPSSIPEDSAPPSS